VLELHVQIHLVEECVTKHHGELVHLRGEAAKLV